MTKEGQMVEGTVSPTFDHPVVMVDEKVQDRTRQVIQNLEAVLKGANMTLKNVVKANIYLSDLSKDFNAVNEVCFGFYA
jgi:2-iminobutanoate/2-iminopropanoate deaminase